MRYQRKLVAVDHVPARRLSSPCSSVVTAAAGTPSAAERLPLTPPSWAAPSGAAAEGRHELRSLLLALCPRPWPERSELVSPRGHGRRGPGREGRSWPSGVPRSSGVTMRGGRRAEQRPGGGRYLKHRPPLGALPSVRSNTSGPDRAWTGISGSVVPVRRTRERGAASIGLIGERPPAVLDPGNLTGALALRSGRNRVLAWGETPRGRGPASFEMCVPPSSPPPLPLSSPCVGFDLPA